MTRLTLAITTTLVTLTTSAWALPLRNGDFEFAADGSPDGWLIEAPEGVTVAWEARSGREDSACVRVDIPSAAEGDGVVISQDVDLEPYTAYLVTGYVKGDGIRSETDGGDETPASIATSDWKCDSVRSRSAAKALGTFDWTPFTLDFATGPDPATTVMCRFGSGGMVGTAWFDDLEVTRNPDVERFEGEHLILNLYKDEVEAATRAGVEQAIRNTDVLYAAYAELTGHVPDDGLKMSAWGPRLFDIEALGWSGNPLYWTPDKQWMHDNWAIDGYCPEVFLHEAAHNFDDGVWAHDCHLSELFMYYACETRDLGISEDSGFRRGPATRDRWVIRSQPEGFPNVCAVILRCIEMRDKIGWEPFRKTYRWYQSLKHEPIPGDALASYPEGTPGELTCERWTEIEGGDVADLTGAPDFAEASDETFALTTFEVPANAAESYGQRVRGYLVPPETGDYTLWLAADDTGELWLSTDDDPGHKRLIAHADDWTSPRQAASASQQSEPIHLEAGRRYFVEALHKESEGGDHLSVAWSPDPADRLPADWVARQATQWGKLTLYLDTLDSFTDFDVRSMFTQDEMELLRWAYEPRPEPTVSPDEATGDEVALGDCLWEAASVGWLEPTRNAQGGGGPLRSDAAWHKSGLYAHAPSTYTFALGGKWSRLSTTYCLQKSHEGSVVFVILGDGKEIFRSDVVRDSSERAIEVDVSGARTLELRVENAGDGNSGDWGVWLSPTLARR